MTDTLVSAKAPAMLERPRIFHGIFNIAGIPGILARGERELGYNSRAYTFGQGVYQRDTDHVIDKLEAPFALWAAHNHDIFHFHFGHSLSGADLWDVKVLRSLGKKVFMHFHGCDVRDSKAVLEKYKLSACAVCWPMQCSQNRNAVRRVAAQHATRTFMSTPDILEFVPGSVYLPQPVDTAAIEREAFDGLGYQPRRRGRSNKVRVVHAPSSVDLKGTRYVREAMDALIEEGVNIEIDYVTGVPHSEVMRRMANSDLVIDQLLIGAYGVAAIEAMTLGVPTICYIREDCRAHYPETLPIIHATPSTLKDVVRAFAQQPHAHQTLAAKARGYALSVHSYGAVLGRLTEHYGKVPA